MQVLSTIVLAGLTFAQDLPSDWQAAYDVGDLLFTAEEGKVKYRPEVGNGYLATVVGNRNLFMAGVFNGCRGEKTCKQHPSHRAAIYSPLRLRLAGSAPWSAPRAVAALDLRSAAYLRRYDLGNGDWAQLRFYAHRARRSLLVAELAVESRTAPEVRVDVAGGAGERSPLISPDVAWSFESRTVAGHAVRIWRGCTREAELPNGEPTRVAVVFPAQLNGARTLRNGSSEVFIAAFRSSLDCEDPVEAAVADWADAAGLSAASLLAEHVAAWAQLWEGGLEVAGRIDVARAVNASLYYIHSSARPDMPYSLSPGGLASNGYNGHTFWDTETWMYPSFVLWHPELAASLLQYRIDRVPGAESKANTTGYAGAMFPWESAFTGSETCPTWACPDGPGGQLEQHITGDIAFAAQQLWYAQQNRTWLALAYPGLLRGTADFWASRVAFDAQDGAAHIRDVICPDEYHKGNDSVFTNFVAQINLNFATEAALELEESPRPEWADVSAAIPILFDEKKGIHPEFDGYTNETIKQADVVLLGFPLMMDMPSEVRKADLDYYAPLTDENGPAMTWGVHALGYLELHENEAASAFFNRSFANAQAPFNVWTETPTGGAVNFLTGAGGFLQTALFGLTGLRILKDHMRLDPQLVEGMTRVVARGLHYRGCVFSLAFDHDAVRVTVSVGALVLKGDKDTVSILAGQSRSLPRSLYTISTPDATLVV